jgi:propanol-preferring alcohol dehydrogenase
MHRALVLNEFGGALEMSERPAVAPGPHEVVIAVRAAGICHSDEHYRSGRSAAVRLPRVLGHEVAGEIVATGSAVSGSRVGERVCVHYVESCGRCAACGRGREQFCERYQMVGHTRDGGLAERVVVPAVNAMTLPPGVAYADGAILMCAGATALHALVRGRLAEGESACIIGAGGIGMFGVQIARAMGASKVFAVDKDPVKLAAAARSGAIAIDARSGDAAELVLEATGGVGVDVAVESIGFPQTIEQAVRMLAVHGRAVVVGLAKEPMALDTYRGLLARETEVMGSNDHLRGEIERLLAWASDGRVRLEPALVRNVPFTAAAVNEALADLRAYRAPVRTVVAF